MSKSRVKLVSLILKESFGDIVQKVGLRLASTGPTALRVLCHHTKLPLNQVKKAVCVLFQHGLISSDTTKRGIGEYKLDVDKVLLRLRFPRYIYCAKTLYGDAAELIVEELLKHGFLTMSQVVEKVTTRLNESLNGSQTVTPSVVHEKFTNLVMTHFLQRLQPPVATNSTTAPPEDKTDVNMYEIPNINLSNLTSRKRKLSADASTPAAKKQKSDTKKSEDEGIYWRINVDRFHQYLRDQAIIQATENLVDKRASEVVRTILRLSEVNTDSSAAYTSPISCNEIFHALPKELNLKRSSLEQYMTLLVGDSMSYVTRCGDSGGGMFSIHFERAATSLCQSHIESVVKERFGSKCLRIFRLLLLSRKLEQKQIESSAMIPAKEAKEMVYKMFSERFLALTEVSKTPDHAPSRTFYLFSVRINQLTRMLLERCYKTIGHVMIRRANELRENRRLLEKSQRVEAIGASLEQSGGDASQRAEVEEQITPPERSQLAKVKRMANKLEQSETQLEESVFVFGMYLDYVHGI